MSAAPAPAGASLTAHIRSIPGILTASPLILLLLFAFFAPLLLVFLFSFMPRGSFALGSHFTLASYIDIVEQGFYISYIWSLIISFSSVAALLLICYPLALAATRLSGRMNLIVMLLIIMPLFVSDSIRLLGFVFILDKGGVLDGLSKLLFGWGTGNLANTVPSVVVATMYINFPFMLFPLILALSGVPKSVREAAYDLGATRWQVMRDIEFPLAMPGVLIGSIMCFVLSLGTFTEAKLVGRGTIITITQDIESAFNFGQNWPRGSAISVTVVLIAMAAVVLAFRSVDLGKLLRGSGDS